MMGEPVYIVRVLVERKRLAAAVTGRSKPPANRDAPLGRKCVSPTLLASSGGAST